MMYDAANAPPHDAASPLCYSLVAASLLMRDHKTVIEIEIHVATAKFGTPVADENVINDDPRVLRNQRAVNKNFVAGHDAPVLCWL
jgi:hypothetical protein